MTSLKGYSNKRKGEVKSNGQEDLVVRYNDSKRSTTGGMVNKGDTDFAAQVRVMALKIVKEDFKRDKAGRRWSEGHVGRRRREVVGSRSWEGTKQAREQMEIRDAAETKENWKIYQVFKSSHLYY